MSLQKTFNSVKGFVEHFHTGEVDQSNVTSSEFWGKSTSVDQQNMFLFKKP
jgi:hypothetical protein